MFFDVLMFFVGDETKITEKTFKINSKVIFQGEKASSPLNFHLHKGS